MLVSSTLPDNVRRPLLMVAYSFGAVACIWLGNMLGRRRTIFLGTSIMVVGAILQTTSYSLPQFIVGRIITGMGNGLNTRLVFLFTCCRVAKRIWPLLSDIGCQLTVK
jgi:MFS family permease